MRLASLFSKPGQPVSIKSVCPDGLTINVDCPPSTSMKKICNDLDFAEADATQIRAKTTTEKYRGALGFIGNSRADILLGFRKTHNRVSVQSLLCVFRNPSNMSAREFPMNPK